MILADARRVLVCGDRDWSDPWSIRALLDRLYRAHGGGLVVIHGAARGADRLASTWGRLGDQGGPLGWFAWRERTLGEAAWPLGTPLEQAYPAAWRLYGLAAGPLRNGQMLTEGHPELVVAFHHHLAASKGTRDMVTRGRAAEVPVLVWPQDRKQIEALGLETGRAER